MGPRQQRADSRWRRRDGLVIEVGNSAGAQHAEVVESHLQVIADDDVLVVALVLDHPLGNQHMVSAWLVAQQGLAGHQRRSLDIETDVVEEAYGFALNQIG